MVSVLSGAHVLGMKHSCFLEEVSGRLTYLLFVLESQLMASGLILGRQLLWHAGGILESLDNSVPLTENESILHNVLRGKSCAVCARDVLPLPREWESLLIPAVNVEIVDGLSSSYPTISQSDVSAHSSFTSS